jgi:hypothetical protein
MEDQSFASWMWGSLKLLNKFTACTQNTKVQLKIIGANTSGQESCGIAWAGSGFTDIGFGRTMAPSHPREATQPRRGGAACQQKAAVRNRALTGPSLPRHGDTKLGQVVTGKSRRWGGRSPAPAPACPWDADALGRCAFFSWKCTITKTILYTALRPAADTYRLIRGFQAALRCVRMMTCHNLKRGLKRGSVRPVPRKFSS